MKNEIDTMSKIYLFIVLYHTSYIFVNSIYIVICIKMILLKHYKECFEINITEKCIENIFQKYTRSKYYLKIHALERVFENIEDIIQNHEIGRAHV